MNILDSRRLYYFHEVARAGSFRMAALSIGVSQSALTRQVQALEEDLGVVLLQRGSRSSVPTEAGEILLARARAMLDLLEETRAALSDVGSAPAGTATLAMLTTFSASFSAALLKDVGEKLPKVSLRTMEGTSRFVEERLIAGQADVGVFIKRPLGERFVLEDLLEEEYHLFGLAMPDRRAAWSYVDIAKLPLVLPLAPFGTRRLIDEAAQREGVKLAARFEVDSPYLIRDLILSSGVYAILPRTALPAERAAGTIVSAPIERSPTRTVVIGTLAGKPLSTAARALAHQVRLTVAARLASGRRNKG